jgi:hypothetical protein
LSVLLFTSNDDSKYSSVFLNIFSGKTKIKPIKIKMMALIAASNHRKNFTPKTICPSEE